MYGVSVCMCVELLGCIVPVCICVYVCVYARLCVVWCDVVYGVCVCS